MAKTRNQLARAYTLRCLTKELAGLVLTKPSLAILLAPVKNLIGVDCMAPRHACGRKAAWLLGSNPSRPYSRHYFRLADDSGMIRKD